MAKKTNIHAELKKLRDNLKISISGHNHRIKEQKGIIKEAKRAIKMHKLLQRSARNQYKVQALELSK